MITITGRKDLQITVDTDEELAAVKRICSIHKIKNGYRARVNRREFESLTSLAKASTGQRNSSGWVHRILTDAKLDEAPKTIVKNGSTLFFTGYGKSFLSNEDDLAANGLGPWVDYTRFAYYR
jgi:hypothetical protein